MVDLFKTDFKKSFFKSSFLKNVYIFSKTFLQGTSRQQTENQAHNQNTNSLQLIKLRNNIRLLNIIIYIFKKMKWIPI